MCEKQSLSSSWLKRVLTGIIGLFEKSSGGVATCELHPVKDSFPVDSPHL